MTSGFDYSLDYKKLDLRKHPELYRIGKGEQGVLMVEPYKSEILPHWRFRTPEVARESSEKIFAMYEAYKAEGDFVGMDMARKFLQMGHTARVVTPTIPADGNTHPARETFCPSRPIKPRQTPQKSSGRNGTRCAMTLTTSGWRISTARNIPELTVARLSA